MASVSEDSLTVVSIEFLDDHKVRELLDQLGVREDLHRLVGAPPRWGCRPAVQPVERWPFQLHTPEMTPSSALDIHTRDQQLHAQTIRQVR